MSKTKKTNCSYENAKETFASFGIDADKAIKSAAKVPVSIHCWQGDDVGGFENLGEDSAIGGGLAVTGNYPGKARNPDELRADAEKAFSLIPGKLRLNLHASYAEFNGKKVDRDAITPKHFSNWIAWAKKNKIGLDFNPTFFAHDLASSGCTLSHHDKGIRDFWVEHGIRCREIAKTFGKELGSSALNNFWVPDGSKDTPADRLAPRRRLADSLDRIFEKKIDPKLTVESVESKLFGVGCESYTVGSHEFYMGYAASRGKFICLDSGHFHPTEVISDKLTGVCDFVPGIALHVSRGVRWDSDHVITLSDELLAIAQELIWNDLLPKTRLGLDYFDASINRIAAWAIGARNARKALLMAYLTPFKFARAVESYSDNTTRLALQEDFKMLPFGAVWDHFCETEGIPGDFDWIESVQEYEEKVLANR